MKKSINSDAVEYLKSFLAKDVKIVDLRVVGKWLKAQLNNGIYFSVRNSSTD